MLVTVCVTTAPLIVTTWTVVTGVGVHVGLGESCDDAVVDASGVDDGAMVVVAGASEAVDAAILLAAAPAVPEG